MKYTTKADADLVIQILEINLVIQILEITRDKLPDAYNRDKIKASINRVIMDLEEFKSISNSDNQ